MHEAQASWRIRKIMVASDWASTLGMIGLLVICVLLLARDVDNFIWGHLAGPAHVQRNFWSIWNKVFETVAAVYFFMFAFRFTQKPVRIACVLMGTRMAAFVLLTFFGLSPSVRRVAALSGSIVGEIALVIFCVAIIRWIGRVVRLNHMPEPEGENQ